MFGVASARWPDGTLQSVVAHGLRLIPVSGVSEAASEEKIGGNGAFNKDMTNDEMTFLDTQTNRQALEPNV